MVHQTPIKVDHLLAPLSKLEIEKAISVVKQATLFHADMRFALIELREPSKSIVQEVHTAELNRAAYMLMYDWRKRETLEVTIDLQSAAILTIQNLNNSEPPNTYLIVERLEEVVFADDRWKRVMSEIGLENNDSITVWPQLEPYSPLPETGNDKIVDTVVFDNTPLDARHKFLPIAIRVNLTKGKIEHFEYKHRFSKSNTKASLLPGGARNAVLKPLSISQFNGQSFKITGSQINWQNWRFHIGINPRRGLEIFDVKYVDNDNARSILYRAGLSEIVTPYGDPMWYSWYASDEGDLNLANYSLISPIPGEDVPPNAKFVTAVIHNSKGEVILQPRGVAIFERDGGLLWRHDRQSRRARELVVASHFMVDNYDYVIYWIFRQDGTIKSEIALTGMINYFLNNSPHTSSNQSVMSNARVAPGILGPIHQHFFNYRLDFDIDTTHNSVIEMNAALTQDNNPTGEWFHYTSTELQLEQDAKRNLNLQSSRWWKIVNPNHKNALGGYPGYALIPQHNAEVIPSAHSAVRRKFGFLDSTLWVTPYDRHEMYAAGTLLGAGNFGKGLPEWVQQNRLIKNKDVVVWYTVGITHLPRPEDWPVMPVRKIGFQLMPVSFFSENPAIDVTAPNPW